MGAGRKKAHGESYVSRGGVRRWGRGFNARNSRAQDSERGKLKRGMGVVEENT